MSRSYRMQYGGNPPNPYRPTRITVRMMNGVEHTLFTECGDETYGHVKRALLPYIILDDMPLPFLRQLSLVLNNDGSYNLAQPLSDDEIVPENATVNLELLIKEPTWTLEQEEVLLEMGRKVFSYDVYTPDTMEAVLWHLQKYPRTYFHVMTAMNIQQIRDVLNVVRHTIKNLQLVTSGLNLDETRELFEMIGHLNTLRYLSINGTYAHTYRMSDLVELLRRNTSIREMWIFGSGIIFDGDVRTLADELREVLDNQYTLERLTLDQNMCQSSENAREFIESIPDALYDNGEISLDWTKP